MNRHREEQDTIAAIATPLGEGGVGIVRISGKRSKEILIKISNFKKDIISHKFYHGWAYNEKGKQIDEIMFVYFKKPKSFTGEEMGEIHCHGGSFVANRILDRVVAMGARTANRGEFSLRAFLSGKIDLIQAESILSIIKAKNKIFADKAISNLAGGLSREINRAIEKIVDITAKYEAWIDFSDEVPYPSGIRCELSKIYCMLVKMLKSADQGIIYRGGINTVIAGSPNVGKSTLMNLLSGEGRAIVHNRPGTTRDTISESVDIGGLVLNLTDTAGLGKPGCEVEEEGIIRTKRMIDGASLILYVISAENRISTDENELLEKVREKVPFLIINKVDLIRGKPCAPKGWKTILASLKYEKGVKEIKDAIIRKYRVSKHIEGEGAVLSTRQKECIQAALMSLQEAIKTTGRKDEAALAVVSLKSAGMALGEMTGKVVSEKVLEKIFSDFCVGK